MAKYTPLVPLSRCYDDAIMITLSQRYALCVFVPGSNQGVKKIKTCPFNENLNIAMSKCAPANTVSCGERTRSWNLENRGAEGVFTASKEGSNYHLHEDESLNESEDVSTDINNNHSETADLHGDHEEGKHDDTNKDDQKTTHAHQTVHDDPLADVVCEEDEEDYVVPDPSHCDRYLVCFTSNQKPAGELSTNQRRAGELLTNRVEVCEEGETLDTETGYCAPRETVDCGPRHLNFRDNLREVEARLEAKVQGILRNA